MQAILELIEQKNQEYAQHPFFAYLADPEIDPYQKLSFAPVIAPLALEFGELCNRVFKQEPTTDPLQAMVNQHAEEEHFHWQWLIEDLEKLGIDYSMRFSDALKFIWSQHTRVARSMYYRFERYTEGDDPILKLVAIEVAEVTANVFFRATRPIALQLQATTGQELRYFGMCHNQVENTHTLHMPDSMQTLRNLEVSEETFQRSLEVVERGFEFFNELMQEFLVYAQTYSRQEPLRSPVNAA
ncbi:hypothetical protein [Geitlerinema sp. PCC 7407]|uniref:hypothetical protein n=1 Tax=Geitlerinema sp. PCC 7407 TaxID=1173025 RepID=UPI00029F8971|nr:hypothetical protein [Geitlerinema sp. PCC 7407]AFY66011.1 hypothetical protein GEI7407_1519 [Geitlerinema sp. PCC 7407]